MTKLEFDLISRAVLTYLGGNASPALELRALRRSDYSPQTAVEVVVREAGPAQQPLRLVAKRFPDGRGAGTFRNMAMLWQALMDRGDEGTLAVPAPLVYDPASRCLIQQKAPGVGLADLTDTAAFEPALALAGRALAELHRCRLPLGTPAELSDHMADLIHPHPLKLAEAWAPARRRILDLVDALAANPALQRGANRPGPVHREFHLRQVFFHLRRVWLVDWDLLARGDPALDLGNFSMSLETRFGTQRGTAAFEAFLSGYCALAGEGSLPRAPAYRALGYLRRACEFCRIGRPDWQIGSAAMLDAAEAAMRAA
ncbi:MAG: phosphotransferase [Betaproteobacteria bacterium]|nr:phosphotransferase [Betaproteobacteria bacterium]